MMKVIRKIFDYLALILIVGGVALVSWQYLINKRLFAVLLNSTNVKESMGVIRMMGYGVLAVIAGLICLLIAMKCGSVVRRNEREKKAVLKEQQKEADARERQLKKEAEETRKELEQAKKENEKIRLSLAEKEENKEIDI